MAFFYFCSSKRDTLARSTLTSTHTFFGRVMRPSDSKKNNKIYPMTNEILITQHMWEEYHRIKPRLRNQALAALIDYLMTGKKPLLTRNTETPFERLLLAYKQKLHTPSTAVHPSVTHPSLICHSSQEEEKKKKASSPCTPICKEEEKEEETLILPTSELASRDTAETDNSPRLKTPHTGSAANSAMPASEGLTNPAVSASVSMTGSVASSTGSAASSAMLASEGLTNPSISASVSATGSTTSDIGSAANSATPASENATNPAATSTENRKSSTASSTRNRTAHCHTKGRFHPPTLDEISLYVSSKGYTFDPEMFFNHYESNGWQVGRTPMKNWHSACVTWQKHQKNYGNRNPSAACQRREADLRANRETALDAIRQIVGSPY